MAITLAELKEQARQMSDMVDNEFVTDSELTNYINFAISELHDILVESYGSDYFLDSTTETTIVNTSDYALPENFYKLRGVDLKINNDDWISVRPFNFNERNRQEDFGAWTLLGVTNVRYRLMGSNIKFTPVPDQGVQFKIWYIPVATKLVADTDELNDINQFSDYVIVTAAMKMMLKEESDASALMSERERIENKLRDAAQNRDAGEPESITDIYAANNDYLWHTTKG